MRAWNIYILLTVLGVQLLQTRSNAYVLLTANLDHLKAISNHMQNSLVRSEIQAVLDQLTEGISRNKNQMLSKTKRRRHNPKHPKEHRKENNKKDEDQRSEYSRRKEESISPKSPSQRAIHPSLLLAEDTKAATFRSDRAIGRTVGLKDSAEPSKEKINQMKRKGPDAKSDYEDILRFIHVAKDHDKAVKELKRMH